MKQLTSIIIGAGSRGLRYATEMAKEREKFKVVGVADPQENRVKTIQDLYEIPAEHCFTSAEDILALPKFADVAIIATQDAQHYDQALKAIELGYDLLLEKPIAQGTKACIDITLAAEKKGVKVLVCHVLRYSPFYKAIKQILMEGKLGEIVSLDAVEAVGNVFTSNCYVRGPWRKEADSNPMLIAKSCHDMDIIQWLIGKPCKKVSSFGGLFYFRPENAPEGAPKRCLGTECPARESCLYSFERVYLTPGSRYAHYTTTTSVGEAKKIALPKEEIIARMGDTNYANCVFHAGNDVVDHQVVNMEFEGGTTVTFNMNAFNKGGRYIRIYGTRGELTAHFKNNEIEVYDFDTQETTVTPVERTDQTIYGGHGGGDRGIVLEMYDYMMGDYQGYCAADIRTSTQNHMIGFAAEKARHEGCVVDMDAYAKEFDFEYRW